MSINSEIDSEADGLRSDLILTVDDKIIRIDFDALESYKKRLGRQIIKDKCGFQKAPNNMEKFIDYKEINIDREVKLTPIGKGLELCKYQSFFALVYLFQREIQFRALQTEKLQISKQCVPLLIQICSKKVCNSVKANKSIPNKTNSA